MIKFVPNYMNFQYLGGDSVSFEEDTKFIFVLMPFGRTDTEKETFDNIFITIKRVIEKACFHGGTLSCSRADLEDGLIIMENVCQKIKKAGLTIFDISVPNLNVYYELGLACALDKKILLTYNSNLYYREHTEEEISFDIKQFRYIEYQSIHDLESKLKKKVETLVKLEDYTKVDLQKIYQKVQKITRHLNLDSKAEQIIEDLDISDYELDKTCVILDTYWDNPKLEAENYSGIEYRDIEFKIRNNIGTNSHSKVKEILRAIYWLGYYQQLIANLEMLPAEFNDVKRDFEQREQQNRSTE